MPANVIQFRPRANPNRDMQAVEIANVKLVPAVQIETQDGIALMYQIEGAPDAYIAPDKDPA